MTKKLLIMLLVLLCALATLAGCGGGGKGDGSDNSGNTQVNQAGTVWAPGVRVRLLIQENNKLSGEDVYNDLSWYTQTPPVYISADSAPEDHEFIFGEFDRPLYNDAKRALDNLVNTDDDEHGWLAYSDGSSVAVAYTSSAAMADAAKYIKANWLNKEVLKFDTVGVVASDKFVLDERAESARKVYRQAEFARIESELGAETANAFRKLFTMFDDNIYVWLANLFEPSICVCTGLSEGVTTCQHTKYCGGAGFYFNNDGRDTVGYLPDIESTVQALHHLNGGGMFDSVGGTYANAFPKEYLDALLKFAQSLQSSEDGYFYHPQWGTNIIAARRGRDLGWAQSLIKETGGVPYWNTPGGVEGMYGAPGADATQPASKLTSKLSLSITQAVSQIKPTASSYLPDYLRSLDAWKDYIDKLNIVNDPYTSGNTLAAQHNEIKAAGTAYIDYLTEYLTAKQNQETGFWGDGVSYVTMNGFMKLSYSYSYYGRIIPNVEKAFMSTIEVLLTPDTEEHDLHVCNTYNTWVNFNQIFTSLAKVEGGKEKVEELRAILREKAPALINITYDKYYTHRQSDGTFSYHEKTYGSASQGAPVSPGLRLIGDVNATSIVTTGTTNIMFSVLGIKKVRFYIDEDMDYFMDLINGFDPVIKNVAPDVETQTFDRYDPNEVVKGVELYPSEIMINTVMDKTELNGVYKFFGAEIVKDPKPSSASDKAMKVNSKVYEDGYSSVAKHSYTYVNIMNNVMLGNMYSFEMDLLVSESENKTIMELAFVSEHNEDTNPSSAFTVLLGVYKGSDGKQYIRIFDKYAGDDGIKAKLVEGIPLGDWFNLKIDLYSFKTTAEGTTASDYERYGVISLNGDVVAVSEASRTGSNGKIVSQAINACTIAYAREVGFEVYVDNIHAEEFIKTYEEPTVPELPAPEGAVTVTQKPGGNGTYYNSTKRGTRLNFNGGKVYLPLVDSGPGNDYFVINPTDPTDRYLAFYRTGASTTHTYMINEALEKTKDEREYKNPVTILEMDAMFANLPANISNFMKITLAEYYGSTDLYFGTDANGNIKFHNVAEDSQYVPMEQGKWYNLRFEYYPISYANKQARVKVYIDGSFAIELSGVDTKYFSSYTTARHKTTFQLQSSAPQGVLIYDNYYFGYDDKVYVAAKEPVPDGLPTISGTHTGGPLFSDSSNLGSRYEYNANTPKPLPLSGSNMSKTYVAEDGYLWFYNYNTVTSNAYISYSNPSSIAATNPMYVLETDFAIGNIPNGKAYAGFFSIRANGFATKVYFGANSDGKIIFPHAVGTAKNNFFSQNEWHNIRFEVYYRSDFAYPGMIFIKVYVDGVYHCDIKGPDVEKNTNNTTLVYIQNISANAWIALDNLYIGFGDKAYVPAEGVVVPEEPERLPDLDERVDGPEGLSGTHTGGLVYNSETSGKRYSFDAEADMPLSSSNTSHLISYITVDKYLLLSQRTKTQAQVKMNFGTISSADAAARKGNVFETDVFFDGVDELTSSPLIGKFILYSEDGGKTSVYFGYDATSKKITIPGVGGIIAGSKITINPKEWTNLRFVYWYNNGAVVVKIYVNGILAAETKGVEAGSAAENRVDYYTHDVISTAVIGLDNIYLGYTTEEYVTSATPGTGDDNGSGSGGTTDPETKIDVLTTFEDGAIPSYIYTTNDKYKVEFAVEKLLDSNRLKVTANKIFDSSDANCNNGNNEWSFKASGFETNANKLVFESDIVIAPANSTNGTYGITYRIGSTSILAFVVTAKDGKVTMYENKSGVSGITLGKTNEVFNLKIVYSVVTVDGLFYPSGDVYVGGTKVATTTSNTAAAEADIAISKISRIHFTSNNSIDGLIYFDNCKLVGLYVESTTDNGDDDVVNPPVDNVEQGYSSNFETTVDGGITTTVTDSASLSVSVVNSPSASYEGDKAYRVVTTGKGATVGSTRIPLTAGGNGDCYVFEADFYYPSSGETYGQFATFIFKNSSDTNIFSTKYYYQNGNASGTRIIRLMADSKGADGDGNYYYFGGFDTSGEWVKMRIEMYIVDGKWVAQYFFDDVFVYEDRSAIRATTAEPLSYLEISYVSRNFTCYYDNVSFARYDIAYSATPETAAPTISGTKGNGEYFNSDATGTRVSFDIDTSNANGRTDVNNDTGPVVSDNKANVDAFNANGYGYVYKETNGTHSGIKYIVPKLTPVAGKSYKTIVELDLAISDPAVSLPFVLSVLSQDAIGTFYFQYDSENKVMYVTDFANKSKTFALNEWHNFRFEVVYTFGTDAEGKTVLNSCYCELYIDGTYSAKINGLDKALRAGYTPYVYLQLRDKDGSVKVSFDNIYFGYEEITESSGT